jgi:NADH:ubiquinone oxidoreductase subunit 3 (subunit A)
MGSVILLFFIQNVLVFAGIFWLLTWLTEWFFQKKSHRAKRQVYECGFRAVSDLNIQLNVNFSLVCVFLVLYDVEFTFLFPFLFNFFLGDALAYYAFAAFLACILVSLAYDLGQNALDISI